MSASSRLQAKRRAGSWTRPSPLRYLGPMTMTPTNLLTHPPPGCRSVPAGGLPVGGGMRWVGPRLHHHPQLPGGITPIGPADLNSNITGLMKVNQPELKNVKTHCPTAPITKFPVRCTFTATQVAATPSSKKQRQAFPGPYRVAGTISVFGVYFRTKTYEYSLDLRPHALSEGRPPAAAPTEWPQLLSKAGIWPARQRPTPAGSLTRTAVLGRVSWRFTGSQPSERNLFVAGVF